MKIHCNLPGKIKFNKIGRARQTLQKHVIATQTTNPLGFALKHRTALFAYNS